MPDDAANPPAPAAPVPDRARAAIHPEAADLIRRALGDPPRTAASDRPRYLTHAEMKAVIAAGGSVLHKGQSLVRVEQLPSQAELDGTGPSAADIEAEIAALHARLAAMKAAEPDPAPEPAKAPEPEKAPAKK